MFRVCLFDDICAALECATANVYIEWWIPTQNTTSHWRESGYINKVLPDFGKRHAVDCVCVVPSISLRLGLPADLAMIRTGMMDQTWRGEAWRVTYAMYATDSAVEVCIWFFTRANLFGLRKIPVCSPTSTIVSKLYVAYAMPGLLSQLRQQKGCCAFCNLIGWIRQIAAQVEHIEPKELERL